MVRLRSNLRTACVLFSVALAMASFVTLANASPLYTFQTLNNPGDVNFNQLLGIDSQSSPLIVGYFGDGTVLPNKGYTLTPPASYTNENFPGSSQTQVIGVEPNNPQTNLGFWVDAAGNNFGLVDQNGTFTTVTNPATPATGTTVNQLLGVNDNNQAVGFYVDGAGNSQAYQYDIASKTFTPVSLPGSFNAVSTVATGINDAGVVSGFFTDTGGAMQGFLDNGGTFTSYSDPNGTNTMFLGINASNEVVGSFVDMSGMTNGLLFTGGNNFQTINDPLASATAAFGVTGTTINGINNAGDLVGFYSDGTNVDGFLATPTATPEPGTIGLLFLGGALIIGRRRVLNKAGR